MGDRSMTIFTSKWRDKNGEERVSISPGIYLHWRGSDTFEMLKAAGSVMRKGDETYSAARFCGYCHEQIDPNLGLGIYNGPTEAEFKNNKKLIEYGPGDNGVFIVDVDSGLVTNVRMDYDLDCITSVQLGFIEMAEG